MSFNDSERRLGERKPIFVRARLVDDRAQVLKIWIVDISNSGVRLQVPTNADISKQFVLEFVHDGARKVDCEIVWRRGIEMGARFITSDTEYRRPMKQVETTRLTVSQLRAIATRSAR